MREAAEYVSVWDGGVEVVTACTVVDGHRIVDVDASDDVEYLESLEDEFLRYQGREFNIDTERMILLESRK